MKLEMGSFEIRQIEFGSKTSLNNGKLTVNREELIRNLAEDKIFSEVGLEIVTPNENTRIIHVLDAVEPRLKVDND